MQPPSLWITSSLALVYLIQIVRHLTRVAHFQSTSWQKVLNAWSILVMVPAIVCALNPAELPQWAALIGWVRSHAISVVAVLLVASEPMLRGGQLLDIQRLILLAERSSDPDTIAEAARQLELHEVYDLAVEGHERAAGLMPDSVREHIHIAALYGILRRFGDAERAAKRAVSLDPGASAAHFYRGMATMEQGHTSEGREMLKKALSLGLPEVQARIAENALRSSEDEHIS